MAILLELSGGIGGTSSDGSLGGARSGTAIVDAVNENLIDDISRKEVLVGKTEYRCYYIYNSHATLPIHGGIVFIDEDPAATTVTMGLDPAGSGDGQTTGVAQTIITEDTAPTGVTFEDAGEFRVKLALPLLRPLESQAIWIKRVASTGAGGTITIGVTATGNEEALPVGPGTEDFHNADGVSIGERTSIEDLLPPFVIGTARIGFSEIG